MDNPTRKEKKAYAMQRMTLAIGRAIVSECDLDKDKAARWAAAWGLVAGIHTRGIRLRRSCLLGTDPGKPGPARNA